MKKSLIAIIVLTILVSACAAETVSEEWATPAGNTENEADYLSETQTAEVQAAQAAEMTARAPTADTRLLPTDWQNWPIIPETSQTARDIYRKGIVMGNDPGAFSKVGDCQNLKEYFLGKFDHLEIYRFNYNIDPYLETIENFKGSFDRDGQSAQFGFTAASPISQLLADPDVCFPEETPLECELRIHNPTFVLISLEFPFNARTPDLYEQYLRKIIEFVMAQGAVPILATKADNVEGDHSINRTITELAYEYDLPMWNWWLAAQPLGDHGIDAYRDGFHISQQAWEERSKTFLQVLDHLWKDLRS